MPAQLAAELSYRQLDHWLATFRHLFTPGARAPGSGNNRAYTPADVATLLRLARLVAAGLAVTAAAAIPAAAATRGHWLTPHVHLRYTPHPRQHRTRRRPHPTRATPRSLRPHHTHQPGRRAPT